MNDDPRVHTAAALLAAAGIAPHGEAVDAIAHAVANFTRPRLGDRVVWHDGHKHRRRKDGSLSPAYYGPGAPPP